MNFSQFKQIFLAHTGLNDGDVQDSVLAVWLNEAQLDLAYECGEMDVAHYSGVPPAEGWELPEDCLTVVDGDDGFFVNNLNKVSFSTGSGGDIYYRKYPNVFTGVLTDECYLPRAVQHLMPIFAAARYWDMESEGDSEEMNLATKWMNYYQMGKATALRNLDQARSHLQRWKIED